MRDEIRLSSTTVFRCAEDPGAPVISSRWFPATYAFPFDFYDREWLPVPAVILRDGGLFPASHPHSLSPWPAWSFVYLGPVAYVLVFQALYWPLWFFGTKTRWRARVLGHTDWAIFGWLLVLWVCWTVMERAGLPQAMSSPVLARDPDAVRWAYIYSAVLILGCLLCGVFAPRERRLFFWSVLGFASLWWLSVPAVVYAFAGHLLTGPVWEFIRELLHRGQKDGSGTGPGTGASGAHRAAGAGV